MASRRALPSATRRSIRARVVSQRRRTSATRQGATFASRFPPRLGRCRCCLPDGASTGDTPQSAAKDASECKRWGLSPPAIISAAATLGRSPHVRAKTGPGLASLGLQRSVVVTRTGHHDRNRAPTVGTRRPDATPRLVQSLDARFPTLPGTRDGGLRSIGSTRHHNCLATPPKWWTRYSSTD